MNSSCLWFQLRSIARLKRGDYIEAEAQYVEQLIIPHFDPQAKESLTTLAQTCTDAAQARLRIERDVRQRIRELGDAAHQKLTRKLDEWWTLDFTSFRAEVKKTLKAEIPLKARSEWEAYLREATSEVTSLTSQITTAEAAINGLVYQLFDLTPDEITLIESTLAGGVA